MSFSGSHTAEYFDTSGNGQKSGSFDMLILYRPQGASKHHFEGNFTNNGSHRIGCFQLETWIQEI